MATPVRARRRPVPPAAPAASAPRTWPAIAVPAALAAVLTFLQITGRSLGFDEGATVAIASQHGSALWAGIAHDGGNMSGYYLLLHVLIGAFGNGLLVLRFVSGAGGRRHRCPGRRSSPAGCSPRPSALAGGTARRGQPAAHLLGPDRARLCPDGRLRVRRLPGVHRTLRPAETDPPGRWAWAAYVGGDDAGHVLELRGRARRPGATARPGASPPRLARASRSALGAVAVSACPWSCSPCAAGPASCSGCRVPTRMVETQVLQSLTSAGLAPSFHHTATTYVLMWGTVAAVVALVVDAVARRRRGEDVWGRALVLAWSTVPAALTFLYSFVCPSRSSCRATCSSRRRPSRWRWPRPSPGRAGGARWRRWPPSPWWLCARAPGRRRLRRLAGALVDGHRQGPGAGAPRGLHRLLPARRPDGVPVLRRAATPAAFAARRARSCPVLSWRRVKSYVEDYATLSPAQFARRAATGCGRLWLVSSHEGEPDGPALSRAHRAAYFRLDAALQAMFGLTRCRATATPAPSTSSG